MTIYLEEITVFVTSDGLGRAAVVRNQEGRIYIYEHWLWDEETRKAFRVVGAPNNWHVYGEAKSGLYKDIDPISSIFGNPEDAVEYINNDPRFLNATFTDGVGKIVFDPESR